MTTIYCPEMIGLSAARLERAYRFLDEAVAADRIPGGALLVARGGQALAPHCCGRQFLERADPPIRSDTIFLVASVTKPVVVSGAMLLVERGRLSLDDRACDYVPEFGNRGKEHILMRHLMTHTSGLPDMLPENYDLRREHAPLSEFVRRVCALELDFAPGTAMQYQSMGLAILGEIIARIAGRPLPAFLQCEVFGPPGMSDTSLGYEPAKAGRIAQVRVEAAMRGTDWGWNTPYWWGLGAPWGGMFTTVGDMGRYMRAILAGGALDGVRLFSPATVAAMTRDQTSAMAEIPEAARLQGSWGLGWRRATGWQWSAYFGDLLSPGAYGHGGATGTAVWNDPARGLTCVLFTTEPSATSGALLGRCSNLVAAAAL
ncbi:MAG: serine hydrolase domain-containing protein [Chloroflexota bacterium]